MCRDGTRTLPKCNVINFYYRGFLKTKPKSYPHGKE